MLGILSNSFMIATRLDGFAYERRHGADRSRRDDAPGFASPSLARRVLAELRRVGR